MGNSASKDRKYTLCWECANAVPSKEKETGCPWSMEGKPVDGWTAKKGHLIFTHGWKPRKDVKVTTYRVDKCPLFQRG